MEDVAAADPNDDGSRGLVATVVNSFDGVDVWTDQAPSRERADRVA